MHISAVVAGNLIKLICPTVVVLRPKPAAVDYSLGDPVDYRNGDLRH